MRSRCTTTREYSCSLRLDESPCSSEDPEQPKINKCQSLKKLPRRNTYDVLSVLCPWNTVMNKLVNSLSSESLYSNGDGEVVPHHLKLVGKLPKLFWERLTHSLQLGDNLCRQFVPSEGKRLMELYIPVKESASWCSVLGKKKREKTPGFLNFTWRSSSINKNKGATWFSDSFQGREFLTLNYGCKIINGEFISMRQY